MSEALKNLINKNLKKSAILALEESSANVETWVSTGNSFLNLILSGNFDNGIPCGRIVEIISETSVGKTTLALQLVREVQKLGGMALCMDTEKTITLPRALELGVNPDINSLLISNIDCLEDILEVMDTFIKDYKESKVSTPAIIILDSVACATPKEILEGEYTDVANRGPVAKVMSTHLPKIVSLLSGTNIALILLNQGKKDITNPYNIDYTSIGGAAIKFYSSIRIELRKGGLIYKDFSDKADPTNPEKKSPVGHFIKFRTIKNKIYNPQIKIELPLLYEEGLDEVWGVFHILKSKGIITSQGAWFSLEDSGIDKFRRGDWPNIYNLDKFKEYFKTLLPTLDPLKTL